LTVFVFPTFRTNWLASNHSHHLQKEHRIEYEQASHPDMNMKMHKPVWYNDPLLWLLHHQTEILSSHGGNYEDCSSSVVW
jgi:hypothetical protein